MAQVFGSSKPISVKFPTLTPRSSSLNKVIKVNEKYPNLPPILFTLSFFPLFGAVRGRMFVSRVEGGGWAEGMLSLQRQVWVAR